MGIGSELAWKWSIFRQTSVFVKVHRRRLSSVGVRNERLMIRCSFCFSHGFIWTAVLVRINTFNVV